MCVLKYEFKITVKCACNDYLPLSSKFDRYRHPVCMMTGVGIDTKIYISPSKKILDHDFKQMTVWRNNFAGTTLVSIDEAEIARMVSNAALPVAVAPPLDCCDSE
jgi:hypothetical protein